MRAVAARPHPFLARTPGAARGLGCSQPLRGPLPDTSGRSKRVECFVFLTHAQPHNPGSGPGRETVHDVKNYSVDTLDRLVGRLVSEELGKLARAPAAESQAAAAMALRSVAGRTDRSRHQRLGNAAQHAHCGRLVGGC